MIQPAVSLKLQYDGPLTIATGRGRKETKWKNQEFTWSQLLARLSTTTRTQETQDEYRAMTKAEQDEIKDIGGFVGGVLNGGRRKTGAVSWRQLITLDADFARPDLWDQLALLWDFAAATYSTHKHTREAPRLRILLPLARPVSPEEYQAVARRVAADLGIDQFDDTTYQPHRLMYWPSTSQDGEYVFQWQDGLWLDPDAVLARYDNWQDPAEWPESSRTKDRRQKLAERQGDPLAKPGLVGQFCRAYSIEEAIEAFLPDVYPPCELPGRYTYAKGSAVGGLVLYDNGRFAYSHHATDPISSMLVNAFDLVRIHKFGDRDEDATPGTPTVKMPSYLAMLDLARGDSHVAEVHHAETLSHAREEFDAPAGAGEEPADTSWMAELEADRKGNYETTRGNLVLILQHDPLLAGCVAMDELAHRPRIMRDTPWGKPAGGYWEDADDAALRNYMEQIYDIDAVTKVMDARIIVQEKNHFHPVRQYLDGLRWDSVPRVDTLLIDFLGVRDNPYIRAVTRKTLCAAVSRVYRPGIKFDWMLTLIGPQGVGKSTLTKRLGRQWHTDSLYTLQGKDAMEQIQGFWIIEMGELAAMRRSEEESLRQFITRQEDTFRAPYGRNTATFSRQCIFIGTTNDWFFLRDRTGNRRFWPAEIPRDAAPVRNVWQDLDEATVGQLWAEALVLWRAGEVLQLPPEIEAIATALQEAHAEDEPRAGQIAEYLNTMLPSDWESRDLASRRAFLTGGDFGQEAVGTVRRERVCIMEIWQECFGGDPKQLTRPMTKELHEIMQGLPGWKRTENKMRFGNIYGVQRGYIRDVQ
jgi:putative DNA primase/helicase